MKIEKKNLDNIVGGASGISINSAFINAFTNMVKVLLEAGKGVGSTIRRASDDSLCPTK